MGVFAVFLHLGDPAWGLGVGGLGGLGLSLALAQTIIRLRRQRDQCAGTPKAILPPSSSSDMSPGETTCKIGDQGLRVRC
jgi:hypothetical protein